MCCVCFYVCMYMSVLRVSDTEKPGSLGRQQDVCLNLSNLIFKKINGILCKTAFKYLVMLKLLTSDNLVRAIIYKLLKRDGS